MYPALPHIHGIQIIYHILHILSILCEIHLLLDASICSACQSNYLVDSYPSYRSLCSESLVMDNVMMILVEHPIPSLDILSKNDHLRTRNTMSQIKFVPRKSVAIAKLFNLLYKKQGDFT
eukprot:627556_1